MWCRFLSSLLNGHVLYMTTGPSVACGITGPAVLLPAHTHRYLLLGPVCQPCVLRTCPCVLHADLYAGERPQ